MSSEAHLRCRLGFHRWAQFKQEDPDLENPGPEAVWVTRCRYCGVERSNGVRSLLVLTGALGAGGGVLWLLVSPVLAALCFLGAVSGVGLVGRAMWLGSYNRRISFRYRG